MTVDFSATTGAFRGGASGTLYGFGDANSPSQPVINGARVTNTSQKPPQGREHPNGDVLAVERNFFAGAGQDIYVYMQDDYPDFGYNGGNRPGDANGDGEWDYLAIARREAQNVVDTSPYASRYVWIPFNETDLQWYRNYPADKNQMLADWSAVWNVVQQVYASKGLPAAKFGGLGDSSFHADRVTDFLTYTKARNQLPSNFIWHELGVGNLATFRSSHQQFLDISSQLGVTIPVQISEFGLLRDMGVPGQLVQWMSMFEDRKVDAQTAYWNYAGNLSDNSARSNGANAGWWMFKWYGDLAGSTTVKLTPPQLNVPDTLQGTAARNDARKTATVLVGGGADDIALRMRGLDSATFGTSVDVVVRADRLNGAEGLSGQPPVVLSTRATISGGVLNITIPNQDPHTAYQVSVTPPQASRPAVDSQLVSSVEAENTTVSNATTYSQDPTRGFDFMASGNRDVGSFNRPGSALTWSVTAPRAGTYRLTVLGGANKQPGKHALFVDGTFATTVGYSADLGWGYRGTADATVSLGAGAHQLSLRASRDGTTLLPGGDITLDRLELRDVTDGDVQTYPAAQARVTGGAAAVWGNARAALDGGVSVSGSGQGVTFYATANESGYHDVATRWSTTSSSALTTRVGGRSLPNASVSTSGNFITTQRVWLTQGVNELTLGSTAGAVVQSITTTRGATQRAADTDASNAVLVQAESLPRTGAATTRTAAAGSNGSADASGVVTSLTKVGGGTANSATWARPAGLGAGKYVVTLAAANADNAGNNLYNPQVISRFVQVSEAGGNSVVITARHNYSYDSFWDYAMPLDLATNSGALTFGNATTLAPDIDTVRLSRLSVGSPTTAAAP